MAQKIGGIGQGSGGCKDSDGVYRDKHAILAIRNCEEFLDIPRFYGDSNCFSTATKMETAVKAAMPMRVQCLSVKGSLMFSVA